MDIEKLNRAADDHTSLFSEDRQHTFKRGAYWLIHQPLSERLTDKEKEKIRKKYTFNDEAGLATAIRTGEMANKYILMRDLLEEIFGADLFKER